ncbi:hypothetical protein NKV53_08565 [Legionella sp. 27cVA30]|uniref:hypothetical protein n=1 Tax=Legionella sp. 27cVA30 TaxID=2905657 RepID=UPI00209E895E|nr:hypothetical protein [Legionella sp. 27cVA30]MCP0914391.1 hypothetical protein [Legionella sp. 27cVA30]
MNPYKELFECLYELINVQIDKYVALATRGVGPDARLNSKLVANEVDELLTFAHQLCVLMHNKAWDMQGHRVYETIFNQIRFYIVQEQTRAHAGWLLDENNFHLGVKQRTDAQLDKLNKIAETTKVNILAAKPLTATQKQCEHDSIEIAFYILDLAKQIKANPTMQFDPQYKIPKHAQEIMRKNATTRYGQFANEIDQLHEKYKLFLETSDLEKETGKLQAKEAKTYAEKHKKNCQTLLEKYKKIEPNSKLFAEDYQLPSIETGVSSSHSQKILFFSGIALVTGLVVFMLCAYFKKLQEEPSTSPNVKFQ